MSDSTDFFSRNSVETVPPYNHQCRILLVDDEEVIRDIGTEMLEALGFTCLTAQDGQEGIRLYHENRDNIALVILDVEMPGLSGDKVYDRLREINPAVKILISSGYAKHHLEQKFFKRKLDHYLSKPFQMNHLVHNLHHLLKESQK